MKESIDITQMYPIKYIEGDKERVWSGEEPEYILVNEVWRVPGSTMNISGGKIMLATSYTKIGNSEYHIFITPRDTVGTEWEIKKHSGKPVLIRSTQKSFSCDELNIIWKICNKKSCKFDEIVAEYFREWMRKNGFDKQSVESEGE